MDTVDEGNEDGLVRKITTEARGIQFSKNYDLSEFTHAKTRQKNQCHIAQVCLETDITW